MSKCCEQALSIIDVIICDHIGNSQYCVWSTQSKSDQLLNTMSKSISYNIVSEVHNYKS